MERQDVGVVGVVLKDELVQLRPLTLGDADEWLAGEDDEQLRGFEFPRRATRDDVVGAIERWQGSWRSGGPVRQCGDCCRRRWDLRGRDSSWTCLSGLAVG